MNFVFNETFLRMRIKYIESELKNNELYNTLKEIFLFARHGISPLVIDFPLASVDAIKFELDEEECLHLRQIHFYYKNERIKVDNVELTLSSIYKKDEYENYYEENTTRKYLFHTNKNEKPWAILKMPQPILIDKVVVFNRKSFKTALRAKTLKVSVLEEQTSRWNQVCCLKQRCAKVFSPLIQRIFERKTLDEQDDFLDTVILAYIFAGGIADELEQLEGIVDDTQELAYFLTRAILYPKKRDYSVHGIRKTFRFWTEKKKVAYIKETNNVIENLLKLTPYVCFAYGSVLGFVRELDSFIKHDDDLDILAAFPLSSFSSLEKAREYVFDSLGVAFKEQESSGIFYFGKQYESLSHVITPSKFKLDVFVGIYNDEGYLLTYPPNRGYYINKLDMFPAIEITIKSNKVLIPRNVITYLDTVYGKDWRVPQNINVHKKYL